MTVRSTLRSPLWAAVLTLALACGGGTKKPDFGGDTEDDLETVEPGDVEADGTDLVTIDTGDLPRDVPPVEDVTDLDTPNTPETEDVEGPTDIPPDVRPDTDVAPLCPCNETTVGAEVCLQDQVTWERTEYKNDTCAKCAICKNDFATCDGCTGEKADCVDLPVANYFTWRDKCDNCPCVKADECERISFPGCGKVCGAVAGNPTEFADVCKMKEALDCRPDYDTFLVAFGSCPTTVCDACAGQVLNKVCGSDNKTYDNQCSLANCGNGATRKCQGACVGGTFCPSCPSDCAPVCGEDGITYGNACAATTCGTGTKKVAYEGFCCPQCDGQAVNEVCGTDGKAYLNQCLALCHGASACPSVGTAVCGNDGKDYPNECWATCKAGGSLHDGQCARVCEQCPTTLSPVCASNTSYQSDCFKTCLGGTGGTSGLCSFCVTQCGTIDSPKAGTVDGPVCGADGITYPSTCFPTKCFGETWKAGACP